LPAFSSIWAVLGRLSPPLARPGRHLAAFCTSQPGPISNSVGTPGGESTTALAVGPSMEGRWSRGQMQPHQIRPSAEVFRGPHNCLPTLQSPFFFSFLVQVAKGNFAVRNHFARTIPRRNVACVNRLQLLTASRYYVKGTSTVDWGYTTAPTGDRGPLRTENLRRHVNVSLHHTQQL
jgi:hypothetical protein